MPQKVEAIAGCHCSDECEFAVKYPSIAATGIGRLIGNLLELVPVKIWGIKISYMIFGLPLAPLAALIYLGMKVSGEKCVLTNRSVARWASFGTRMLQSMPLVDIAEVSIFVEPGQEFFDAGDVYLMNAKGDPVMVLKGMPYPEILKANILESRDAQVQVQATLKTIAARQTA